MWIEITYIGDAFPYNLFLCYESGMCSYRQCFGVTNLT